MKKDLAANKNITVKPIRRSDGNESAFAYIVENSPDLIVLFDENNSCIFASPSVNKICGYTAEDINELNFLKLIHADDVDSYMNDVNKSLKNKEKTAKTIFRIRCKNGQYIWTESISNRRFDQDGNIMNTLINCRDITPRKEAEKQLKSTDEKLKMALDIGKLLWWEWDFTAKSLLTDFKQVKILDVEVGQIQKNSEHIQKLIHPDDLPAIRKSMDEHRLGEKKLFNCEFRIATKDSEYKWMHCRGKIMERSAEGNPLKMNGLVIEITDYRKALQKVRESEEKLRNIFDSSPETILIADAGLNIMDCNQEALNLFGYSKKELIKMNPYMLLDEEDREKAEMFLQKFNEIGLLKGIEFTFKKHNGDKLITVVSGSIVCDEENKPKLYIIVIQDISQFKKIESELVKAKERAEEADNLKSAFLANMSHEIRTPMNAIIGFSDLLADPSLKHSDAGLYTGVIKERCNNLLHIVNDILDISRIEANQVELRETSFSVNALLEELYIVYAQRLINENKFQVVLNLTKDAVNEQSIIIADDSRLKQVLNNLLDNAIKFTKKGEIEFGYSVKDGFLEFFVKDSGIGIKPDKHEMIFERFRQIDESLDREYGGNGLGLAICKAFVELMGGTIWLKSGENSGTTFYFTIPYSRPNEIIYKPKPETDIVNYKWRKKRILIVEDDKASLSFMKVLFKLTEAEIIPVQTGHEAIELYMNDKNFDLVLMDIQLPDINGLEVTKMFKSMNRYIPVIAQTAYAMHGDDVKCLNAGCDDYISKPVEIADLFFKIDKFLGEGKKG